MIARHAFGCYTLQELIEQPCRIYSVPTLLLQQQYAQSAAAVSMPDLQDSTREYLQSVRRQIAEVLDIRRRLDQKHQATAQDAPETTTDQAQPETPISDDERIGRALRAVLRLAGAPPDDRPDGGTRQPVRPRPTPPPVTPSQTADPVSF